jgi:hypothetical protein
VRAGKAAAKTRDSARDSSSPRAFVPSAPANSQVARQIHAELRTAVPPCEAHAHVRGERRYRDSGATAVLAVATGRIVIRCIVVPRLPSQE